MFKNRSWLMCIKYIDFSVEVYGLRLKTSEEVEDFIMTVINAVKKLHPLENHENDIEVRVNECAGSVDGKGLSSNFADMPKLGLVNR